MTHRDGFPRLSVRSAWRGDARHRKPCGTPSESLGKQPPVGQANRRRASESLDDVPHRSRLPCYPPGGPSDRPRDLYGSLSTLLGISARLEPPGSAGTKIARKMPEAFGEGNRRRRPIGFSKLRPHEFRVPAS